MFNNKKSKVYGLILAFASIIPILTYFSVELPRVAWASEVIEVDRKHLRSAIDLYERELQRRKYERRRLSREIAEMAQENQLPTNQHLSDEVYLDSDIKKIEEFLAQAKKELFNEH